MTEIQGDSGRRSHALLISSDPEFVDRAQEVLHMHMRVATASASDGHLETIAQSANPDLFIIDVDNIDWQISGRMTTIEQMHALFPEVPIAFTSYDISTATLIPAMRAGASDVFDKSASGDEILAIVDHLANHRSAHVATGDGQVINIMGLRAGIGATTLALALAQSILEMGPELGSVLYLDFSAAPCESADLLGIKPNYAMQEAINDLSRLDASMIESAFSRTDSGLYVLPICSDDAAANGVDMKDIPSLIYVLKTYFTYIFVDPNRHGFSSTTFDRLFSDSDISILCTDQSVTSIHACTAFLQQFIGGHPEIPLAITRYDPRIAPDADSIAQAIGAGSNYHVVPWDRQHVESRRNAGLPLIESRVRSPFAESARRLMARIDEPFSDALAQSRKNHKRWQNLLRLGR